MVEARKVIYLKDYIKEKEERLKLGFKVGVPKIYGDLIAINESLSYFQPNGNSPAYQGTDHYKMMIWRAVHLKSLTNRKSIMNLL